MRSSHSFFEQCGTIANMLFAVLVLDDKGKKLLGPSDGFSQIIISDSQTYQTLILTN